MKLKLYQVDSFAEKLFTGNPAGVVLDAQQLSADQMQKIARELNNSETAFIVDKPGDGYDMEVRFFTPGTEVPICGHATIAAHYVYGKVKGITDGTVVQKTGAGNLPVDMSGDPDDPIITMTQGRIEFGQVLEDDLKEQLLEGLNIDEDDLDPGLPIQIVSTGHSKVMVPLLSKERLNSLQIRKDILSSLSRKIYCNGFYAFTLDSREEGILACGRMFAPLIGIDEDPVTGNANGPLGAYLTHYGKLERKPDGLTFSISQGEQMGRPGRMDVHVFSSPEGPEQIKISGKAIIVFETELVL